MASVRKTMENTTQEESEEETSSNEDTTIRSDAYLLESMAILEDYIRLQQRVEAKGTNEETEFPPSNTLPVLIDADQIRKRVEELGRKI